MYLTLAMGFNRKPVGSHIQSWLTYAWPESQLLRRVPFAGLQARRRALTFLNERL